MVLYCRNAKLFIHLELKYEFVKIQIKQVFYISLMYSPNIFCVKTALIVFLTRVFIFRILNVSKRGIFLSRFSPIIVKTQRNLTQLKTTLKQLTLELDTVVTCSTPPPPPPQTFQPLLDQLES